MTIHIHVVSALDSLSQTAYTIAGNSGSSEELFMVVHNAGRCSPSAQHGAETPLQGHDSLYVPGGDGNAAPQSALRALLLLSGAVSPHDFALNRTSDADLVLTADILTMLGTLKPATHAA